MASLAARGQLYHTLGRQYTFNTTMYTNSSRVAAIWLETPLEQPIGSRIDGDTVVGRSSAYLNVQIPRTSSLTGFHAACSIDARWAQSQILGSQIAVGGLDSVYQAADLELSDPSIFPALNNGNWRTVRLGIDWLNTLTPQLAYTSYWNTLSSTITAMGLDNSTGLVASWEHVGILLAAAVSTVVVDGMSRTGYEKNGGLRSNTSAPLATNATPSSESWDPLLAGSYVLPYARDDDGNATNRFEMYWSVAVTGLGYRADSVAYYLALIVLLAHAVFAIGHIIWVFWTRDTSTAWSSLTDLIVLALKSTPPDATLDNSSVGVERYKTFREPIYIRTIRTLGPGGAAPHGSVGQGCRKVELVLGANCSPDRHKTVLTEESCL